MYLRPTYMYVTMIHGEYSNSSLPAVQWRHADPVYSVINIHLMNWVATMMRSQYDTLGWNEENVLTLPSFRAYLCKSLLRFIAKLMIIVSIHTYVAAIDS